MKKIAILQSNYIPWKGYFDLINMVDEFILYDDMQYTRRDWRNRNKIKTPDGSKWLTIPVNVKGKYFQKINETKISDPRWQEKHWQQIEQSYKKAPYFNSFRTLFEAIYMNNSEIYLSQINYQFIITICDILGITTTIRRSSEFNLTEGRNEKLLSICKQAQSTVYLSGPTAKGYLDESLFTSEGIKIEWMNYNGYLEYSQLFPPFKHDVTILDLLFNTGDQATTYMRSFS